MTGLRNTGNPPRSEPLVVHMVCNNCGQIDSGPEGGMYECPACGWGDGWGEGERVVAERRAAEIAKRGRLE